MVGNFAQSDSPGNEQRDFWGSEPADREGSTNLIGVKSPAIDKLIDHVIFAKDRAELVAATNALDRALLWNEFVVPQWYSPNVRIAYWDRYGQPKLLPGLTPGFLQVWWFDQTLASRVAGLVEALMARGPRPCAVRSPAVQPSFSPSLRAPAAAAEAKARPLGLRRSRLPGRFRSISPMPTPTRPKGGTFSLVGWGGVTTFNSLNNYILKGDAAQGLELLFDSLMVPAADEPDAVYGLVAESAEVADDGKSVTFYLRPEAKFADGTPLTADDVVFSFDTLKTKGHPLYHQTLQDVVKAEALDPAHGALQLHRRSRARPAAHRRHAADLLQGLLRDAAVRRDHARPAARLRALSGRPGGARAHHRLSRATRLLGQGPAGQSRALELRQDPLRIFPRPHRRRWRRSRPAPTISARSSPRRSGRRNTTFPAIRAGKVKKEMLPDETPSGTQGFFLNTRRETLKDPRVRQALDLAFDFEWSNRNMFYGLYDAHDRASSRTRR